MQRVGDKLEFDPDLVIPDKTLTIAEGQLLPGVKRFLLCSAFGSGGEVYGFDIETPVEKLIKTIANHSAQG